jgi:hypothetical protein
VILEQKCTALFSATLVKQLLWESSGTSFLNYWRGAALRRVKPDLQGNMSRRTNALFCDIARAIICMIAL